MSNYQRCGSIVVSDGYVSIDGKLMPPCPKRGSNSTIIGNKVYLNGYELTDGEWKITIMSIWHKYF